MSNKQKDFCKQIKVDCLLTDGEDIIGVADDIKDQKRLPINGLRHIPETGTCGWFIWSGEVLSSETDFFKPQHVRHLLEVQPEIEKFFGLPPGWRFLYTPTYEDVWFDPQLLDI